jgi:phage tail sheath protein FI
MAKTYKRPDVYIEEKSVFGKSIQPVETAVPAFIGYTEKRPTTDDEYKFHHISSLENYRKLFGGNACTDQADLG